MNSILLRGLAICCATFFTLSTLSSCKKKEEDDQTLTTLLLGTLLLNASATAFAGSCHKFSVNSSCVNSYGTFSANSCTGAGGTVGSSRCATLTNFGSCRSGSSETVFYSGGTSPTCGSSGACQTLCVSNLGTYSASYSQ